LALWDLLVVYQFKWSAAVSQTSRSRWHALRLVDATQPRSQFFQIDTLPDFQDGFSISSLCLCASVANPAVFLKHGCNDILKSRCNFAGWAG